MNEAEPEIDLDYDRLLAEIEAEARARREAGDYPPGFEAELDALFARFAPAAATEDFDEVLEQASRAAAIDAEIPIESERPGGAVVKRGIASTIGWYHAFLAGQVIEFASVITHAVRLLAQRTDALETAVAASLRSRQAAERVASGGFPSVEASRATTDALTGVVGRVLVAECGEGALLATLGESGIDAYGVDSRRSLVDAACARGLDAHPDDVRSHLGAVTAGTVAAVVLTGIVERRPVGELMDLLDLALSRLGDDGRLVIASRGPIAVAASDPVLADLSPGRPLHPDTWHHLLSERGWSAEAPYVASFGADRGSDSGSVVSELVGPAEYVVVGTKRSS